MGYRMKGFSGFKSSPAKAGAQSTKEALDEASAFNPDKQTNKLDGNKTSTQNKHTETTESGSQYKVRENKTRN